MGNPKMLSIQLALLAYDPVPYMTYINTTYLYLNMSMKVHLIISWFGLLKGMPACTGFTLRQRGPVMQSLTSADSSREHQF